ncbi:winged helix-turn-helix transcriptional regulator [Streptomyces cyaneofuscatus]|uniref:winged helix-turn-helix transcriptional regulator n=1 Tax=Streptomyces cyaneofuscatus TaxID=66883 RepID=UPI002953513F|nr:winged helix-turn-helix transcriptional regulator [Streptomyces cyaneofuscatus]WOP12287.1 winged helix-turn-helix transcriptional regulator [Streptomyces cyaneofuscatus]
MPRQQPAAQRPVRRRSYDQFCASARALDSVGDRWTLLIVRELLAGPRRYTDLHADLPGVSTDVLASRLKDMEQGGLAVRRRLPPPAAASVYELTERGHGLLPVLAALAEWGAPALAERRPTDAVRAHWFALPLLRALTGLTQEGVLEVRLVEGEFHVRTGRDAAVELYGFGPAPQPDARITLDAELCLELGRGDVTLAEAVKDGRIEVAGDGPLAAELRGG